MIAPVVLWRRALPGGSAFAALLRWRRGPRPPKASVEVDVAWQLLGYGRGADVPMLADVVASEAKTGRLKGGRLHV